jgi:Ohr subfamily peroxiredoxin
MKTLYTAHVTVRSGRDGSIRSSDGLLEARLAFPTALGGDGKGTNPEQLFAAGYAACFASTLTLVAKKKGLTLTNVSVDSEVDMLNEGEVFDLAVRLKVHASGADRAALEDVLEAAREVCPYARATRKSLATSVTLA